MFIYLTWQTHNEDSDVLFCQTRNVSDLRVWLPAEHFSVVLQFLTGNSFFLLSINSPCFSFFFHSLCWSLYFWLSRDVPQPKLPVNSSVIVSTIFSYCRFVLTQVSFTILIVFPVSQSLNNFSQLSFPYHPSLPSRYSSH